MNDATEPDVSDDPEAAVRRRLLEEVLAAEFGDLGVTSLQPIGGGLESVVYKADSGPFGPVAIKLPLRRVLSTGNEAHLDTRDLLTQEFRLGRLARKHGVPCPEPLVLHTDDASVDFLMVEHVATDDSEPGLGDLGRLVHQIHALDVDPLPLVAMEDEASTEAVVLRRTVKRYERLGAWTAGPFPAAEVADALAESAPAADQPVLLHMDARPANLLTRQGEVVGIVDWSNALFGPACLELARIAESGNLTPEFLAGYGPDGEPFEDIHPVREVLYRLDTAVMLAHVFLDNHAPPAVAERQTTRVRRLIDALEAGERPDDAFLFRPHLLTDT